MRVYGDTGIRGYGDTGIRESKVSVALENV